MQDLLVLKVAFLLPKVWRMLYCVWQILYGNFRKALDSVFMGAAINLVAVTAFSLHIPVIYRRVDASRCLGRRYMWYLTFKFPSFLLSFIFCISQVTVSSLEQLIRALPVAGEFLLARRSVCVVVCFKFSVFIMSCFVMPHLNFRCLSCRSIFSSSWLLAWLVLAGCSFYFYFTTFFVVIAFVFVVSPLLPLLL